MGASADSSIERLMLDNIHQTTAEGATETDPADTGCGSAFTGVAVMISMLGLGVYALARKRKED